MPPDDRSPGVVGFPWRRCVAVAGFLAAVAVGCRGPAPQDDARAIIGWWRVVESVADGEPDTENVGVLHHFKESNRMDFYSGENLGHQEYRIVPDGHPKELVASFGDPSTSGAGIYELNGDTLRWRTSLDRQPLNFVDRPTGSWWDLKLTRLNQAQADAALQELKEARDKLEAEESPSF